MNDETMTLTTTMTCYKQAEFLKVLGGPVKFAEKAPTVEFKAAATHNEKQPQQQQAQKQQQKQPQQQGQGQGQQGQQGGKKKEKKEKKGDRQKGRREPEKKIELNEFYGTLPLNCSQARLGKTFVKVKDITPALIGQT